MFYITFFFNYVDLEILWNSMVEADRTQMIIYGACTLCSPQLTTDMHTQNM